VERLEAKKINGHTYYYYSKWQRTNGRCRRVWQEYLGKLEDIAAACSGGGQKPLCAEVFEWGLPEALWVECRRADVIGHVDRCLPKRRQGLSTGQYLAIAAINRAIHPCSKRSMWEWFSQTALRRRLPRANQAALTSQRFWDHMDRLSAEDNAKIWRSILAGVLERERIDLSSISYDGTNFYTFIDTFNVRCEIARRGKNKQGRGNLRQVSYALFCCADGQLPLFYEVYEGNRNDARQFPQILRRFHRFFEELAGAGCPIPETTVVFDKGNNSADNFRLLDSLELKFVGSVKLDEHSELASVANDDPRWTNCDGFEGTKSFRVTKTIAGQERVLVVTYNQNLFDAQWRTLQNDIAKATEKLSQLRQRLGDRVAGIIKGGKAPTVQSVAGQCKAALSRQHMKQVVTTTVESGPDGIPRLEYAIDTDAHRLLADTILGKTILVSNRAEWSDEQIITAYRSQYQIEEVFKQMKDRDTGNWWPLHHWTDSKIHAHGLYCTIALLLRAVLHRRVRQAGVNLSMGRFLSELRTIREVVNIYPRKGRSKTEPTQAVLTQTSPLQQRLLEILGLDKERNDVLG